MIIVNVFSVPLYTPSVVFISLIIIIICNCTNDDYFEILRLLVKATHRHTHTHTYIQSEGRYKDE